MWTEDHPKKGSSEYYYAMASEELSDNANPWGSGPSKKQIKDRAAQLALKDEADYKKNIQTIAQKNGP